MGKSRRIASARPPPGGAERASGEGIQIGPRARELGRAILDGFNQHDLLTCSSAISFQILTAAFPFALFLLAVAGTLHLNSVWQDHLAPRIQANVPTAMFTLISNAVNKTTSGRVTWATFGGLLALWQVSGAVRAVMGGLARIYGAPTERSFLKRFSVSFVLSIEVGGCFVLAGLCVLFAPFFTVVHPDAAWQVLAFLVRWVLAAGLLLCGVAVLVRHAPSTAQPLPWVSLGAAIVVVSWVVASFLFYWYLTTVAAYKSEFGDLASLIGAMAYLYILTTVFLLGVQLDAIVRAQVTGHLSGVKPVLTEDG